MKKTWNKFLRSLGCIAVSACFALSGCSTGNGSESVDNTDTSGVNDNYFAEYDYSDYTDMGKTVNLANRLANGVQGYYADSEKEAYTVENMQVSLTHNLTKANAKYVSELKSKKGGTYLFNTMDVYIEKDEDYSYAGRSDYAGFVNTNKLGYYYYETNVRDLMFNESLYAEKTYHVYSDRIYQEFRLLAALETDSIDSFGFEAKLRGDTVDKIEIYDGKNYYDTVDGGYDEDSVRYVAFDIKDVGVVAFINSSEECSVKITRNEKGAYKLHQSISLKDVTLYAGESVYVGNRLYTDETHDFEGVRKANLIEENPLTEENISVDETLDRAAFTGYDRMSGAYTFFINGSGFEYAYANPEKRYLEKISVRNVSDDRDVFFYIHSENPLEGAAIIDSNDLLLPMGLEVCKNFNHEKEEPIYDPTDQTYGDTILPIALEKGKDLDFTVLNVYQNWGKYPIKQLSSISYYMSYYHLSTGIRETMCIAPYFSGGNRKFLNKSWILPDFRGASCDQKTQADSSGQQRDSVGALWGVSNGFDLGNYRSSLIRSAGLTYADLDYSYVSADGNYKYTYRHVEMPQTDESRTYYTVEIEFINDMTVDPTSFSIFGFDGRNSIYSKAAYLGENGEKKELTNLAISPDGTVGTSSLYKLNEGSAYFTYYDISAKPGENGNFGLILKNYEITKGGTISDLGMAFYDSSKNDLNYGSLTIAEKTDFKAGDKIKADVILLPYGARSGQSNYDSVLRVYEDSVLNPLKIKAERGSVLQDSYIPTVKAENDIAEFTISGGVTEGSGVIYTIKASGFGKLGRPMIRELVNGTWVNVDIASAVGYDGYSVSYENGKFTYSFAIAKGAANRTFKVVII